jgi:hypothetical protein
MAVGEVPVKGQITQATPPTSTYTKKKLLYALLAALVVAVVVAVPVTVTQFAVHRRSSTRGSSVVSTSGSGSVLTVDYCSKLYGDAKTYCKSYLKSSGPNKFMAASIWLQVSQATRKHMHIARPHLLQALLLLCCWVLLGTSDSLATGWRGGWVGGVTCVAAAHSDIVLLFPCRLVPCRRVCWARRVLPER